MLQQRLLFGMISTRGYKCLLERPLHPCFHSISSHPMDGEERLINRVEDLPATSRDRSSLDYDWSTQVGRQVGTANICLASPLLGVPSFSETILRKFHRGIIFFISFRPSSMSMSRSTGIKKSKANKVYSGKSFSQFFIRSMVTGDGTMKGNFQKTEKIVGITRWDA